MICMNTSLATSIKLPTRTTGSGACWATASDATTSTSTPINAPCVNRLMVVSSIVFFPSSPTLSALRIWEHTLEEVGQPTLHEVGQPTLEENLAWRYAFCSTVANRKLTSFLDPCVTAHGLHPDPQDAPCTTLSTSSLLHQEESGGPTSPGVQTSLSRLTSVPKSGLPPY